MKKLNLFLSAVIGGSALLSLAEQNPQKPNVLFLSIDDLNDWIGCLGGHPQTQTPNIDRLAKRSVLFSRHYCAAPMCNPSRTAMFLGVRPDRTRIFGNSDEWQNSFPDHITLPGYFRTNGYHVAGCGKLFHQEKNTRHSDWDEYFGDFKQQIPLTKMQIKWRPLNGIKGFASYYDWGPLDTEEENMSDMQVAAWAESFLQRKHEKPFFLATGIFLPHLPWYAPKKYFDELPLDSIILPPILENDLDDIPPRGLNLLERDEWSRKVREGNRGKEAVHAYLACIRFTDACVGRVLDALDNSPYADNTIIVLWSDHGMHLGEKGHYSKFTLWERSAHSPMMISPPKAAAGVRHRPVSSLDIFPTLIELAGLPPAPALDGQSLMPLLKSADAEWTRPAVTIYHGDRAARSDRWRYIRYADGKEELYDHETDPNEWHNIADNPEYSAIKEELKKFLTLE